MTVLKENKIKIKDRFWSVLYYSLQPSCIEKQSLPWGIWMLYFFFSLNEKLNHAYDRIDDWKSVASSKGLFIRDPAHPDLYIFMCDKGKS